MTNSDAKHTSAKLTYVALTGVFALAALCVAPLGAQQPGFKRIPLQDQDLSAEGRHVVQAIAEFDSGVSYIVRKGEPVAPAK